MVYDNNRTSNFSMEDNSNGTKPQWRAMPLASVALANREPVLAMTDTDGSNKAQSPTDEREFTTAKAQIGWRHPVLTRLGPYYPLETNHTIFPLDSLESVLNQLRASFHHLSMHVEYRDSPLMARCFTLDFAELYVHLWESRSDSGKVILEVQRRAGDAIIFGKCARQIIASVDAVLRNSAPDSGRALPQTTTIPPATFYGANSGCACWGKVERLVCQNLPHHRNVQPPDDYSETVVASALAHAYDLLSCGRYDARRLGLESLRILTDPSKSGMGIAKLSAKAILLGESPAAKRDDGDDDFDEPAFYKKIQEIILPLAITGSSSSAGEERGVVFHPEDQMHVFLAVEAVANAFQVLLTSDNPAQHAQETNDDAARRFLEDSHRLLAGRGSGADDDDALMSMLSRVAAARDEPHLAYFAAQTLAALCQMEPAARNSLRAHCAADVAQEAHRTGAAGHAALEAASLKLLVALHA